MKAFTPLSLIAFLVLLVLLPLLFAQLMAASLIKLSLEPGTALLLMIGIIVGSGINIPVKRIERPQKVPQHPLAIFGLGGMLPEMTRMRQQTIIAVNVGGCLIPAGLAAYEFLNLADLGPRFVVAGIAAGIVNVVVCYLVARPVPGVGILIPGFVPALVAATLGVLLGSDQAAPVAFVAGTLGPLIGADLLHLREIEESAVGVASIGGAGTFDGIVLSGIIAAYLA
ncbi:MAG TPA: DUF1614 domain-containing protein [Stellaceae bacterium]|nr:DUF1614 domain-containing protein [Stellaceae bacterium]